MDRVIIELVMKSAAYATCWQARATRLRSWATIASAAPVRMPNPSRVIGTWWLTRAAMPALSSACRLR